jgi:hypothetical protein
MDVTQNQGPVRLGLLVYFVKAFDGPNLALKTGNRSLDKDQGDQVGRFLPYFVSVNFA